jgi:hypothetical protein
MTILEGDYACLPISGQVGTLISVAEWLDGSAFGHYDHTVIYAGMADKNAPFGYTMGAYPGGARLYPMPSPGQQNGWLWSSDHFALDQELRSQIVANALACKGIGYSAADYFALVAHRFHLPVPELKEYIADSGHMICSQLVDWCYMQAGIHLFTDGRWPGYVTPADLAAILESND